MNASPGNHPTIHTATPADLGLSLQLSRASLMALTRLQLAMQSGDRQATMAAMDRLHALDAEMERLVGRLPSPDNDTEWSAITKHVSDQKLAIAFEKLALVSEISGPGMVSQNDPIALSLSKGARAAESDPDWPPLPELRPTEWRPARPGVIAVVLALLVTVALAAAAVLMTAT